MQQEAGSPLNPVTEAGMTREKEQETKLSEIIHVLNKKNAPDFTTADKLFFDQIEEELVQDTILSQRAKSNSIQNFKYGFDEAFRNKLIERMEDNQDIFPKILDDKEFGDTVKEWMLKKVYDRLTQ